MKNIDGQLYMSCLEGRGSVSDILHKQQHAFLILHYLFKAFRFSPSTFKNSSKQLASSYLSSISFVSFSVLQPYPTTLYLGSTFPAHCIPTCLWDYLSSVSPTSLVLSPWSLMSVKQDSIISSHSNYKLSFLSNIL